MSVEIGIGKELQAYQQELACAGYRGLVVISGQRQWCYDQARAAVRADQESLWIGAAADEMSYISARECIQHLGREHTDVVFDTWNGFDADALGAISGTLRAGSILYLLTPDFTRWELYDDPEHKRILVEPYTSEDVGRRFIRHIIRELNASQDIQIWHENSENLIKKPEVIEQPDNNNVVAPFKTSEQELAVQAISRLVSGHRHRPLLLVADRGRGKSSALGIAAAQLLARPGESIGVTAPSIKQVNEIFARIRELHPKATQSGMVVTLENSRIEFFAPDALLQSLPKLNLLLVDEAAAIPLSMLEEMLKNYSRVVYSTTVHGYEGTGKGFEKKFQRVLDSQCEKWSILRLQRPIRWNQGDVLENIVNRLLLLDAEVVNADLDYRVSELEVSQVDRDDLVCSQQDLKSWFGLLVSAHYKTRPYDLRQILDGPNIKLWNVYLNGCVIATAVVAEEGIEFDKELANSIYKGQRRLHGHLMPQTLAVHAGDKSALNYRYIRVVRIAVADAYRRRGLGRLLLNEIEKWAISNNHDYMAVSFGLERDLLKFWMNAGYKSVRFGLKKEASTGQHNIMMLKSISDRASEHLSCLQNKFNFDLPYLLAEPLKEIDASYIVDSIGQGEIESISIDVINSLQSFVVDYRLYDSCIRELNVLLSHCLLHALEPLDKEAQQALKFLIERVWQKRGAEFFVKVYGVCGKANMLEKIKSSAGILLRKCV